MNRPTSILLAFVALTASGCSPDAPTGAGAAGAPAAAQAEGGLVSTSLEFPSTSPFAEAPRWSRTERGAVLSWIEPHESGPRWYYAERGAGATDGAPPWGIPCRLIPDSKWTASADDPPSVLRTDDDGVAAIWPFRPGSSARHTMHIGLGHWQDGKRMAEVRLHDDDSPTEHAFASASPAGDGTLDLIWLDGRKSASTDRTELMHRAWGGDGLQAERTLDANVCACCSTAVSRTVFSDGEERLAVVYRDRTDQEIRDISLIVRRDGVWAEPMNVHADGWHIAGCPVNGPALDDTENGWVVAWFTAADDRPQVAAAFGDDGAAFDAPIVVDDRNAVGHAAVVSFGAGRALVVWSRRGEERTELVGRWIERGGAMGAIRSWGPIVGKASMVRNPDGSALLAWTEPLEAGSRVRLEQVMLR